MRKWRQQGREKAQLEEGRKDCGDWGATEVFRELGPQDQLLPLSQAGLTPWRGQSSLTDKSTTRVLWAEQSTRDEEWGQCPEVWQEERRKELEDWSGNVCSKTNIGKTCVDIVITRGFFFLFFFLLLSLTVLHGTLVVLRFTLKHPYLAGAHDVRGEGGNWCPWKGCCQG